MGFLKDLKTTLGFMRFLYNVHTQARGLCHQ